MTAVALFWLLFIATAFVPVIGLFGIAYFGFTGKLGLAFWLFLWWLLWD